jgi:hypothetical protein
MGLGEIGRAPTGVVWGTRENAETCDLTSSRTLQSDYSLLA